MKVRARTPPTMASGKLRFGSLISPAASVTKYHDSYVHITAIIAIPNDARGRPISGGTTGVMTGVTRVATIASTGSAANAPTFAAVSTAVTILPGRTPT